MGHRRTCACGILIWEANVRHQIESWKTLISVFNQCQYINLAIILVMVIENPPLGLEKGGGKRTRESVQKHTTVNVYPSAKHGIAAKINHSQLIFGKKIMATVLSWILQIKVVRGKM
jgi:hypothetical protein